MSYRALNTQKHLNRCLGAAKIWYHTNKQTHTLQLSTFGIYCVPENMGDCAQDLSYGIPEVPSQFHH